MLDLMESSKHIPAEWFCPITGEVMNDPVIATDGNTYERKAILEWIEKSEKSPISGEALASNNVVPNLALKATIEKMLPEYIKAGASMKSEPKINSQSEDLQLVADSIVDGDSLLVNVSVVPPKEPKAGKRKPCAIIAILDISGSMDTEASQANPDDKEAHGFSRLDLVKHSVNTIINSLSEGDYLALVPFSDTASVRLPLTLMNKDGKAIAEQIITDMKTEGSTNIWDGLRVGLDLTKQGVCSETNTFVLLLTDGEPNQNPPEGNLPALQNYIKKNGLTSNIHVFGYGYNLDTLLLTGIAKEGLGSYGYIPDCSMVGTIFVNFLSNTLATFLNIADLTVHAHHAKLTAISGYDNIHQHIGLGGIQYGQSRDILYHFTLPQGDKDFAEFELHYGFGKKKTLKLKVNSKEPKDIKAIQFQLNRSAHIDGLTRAYAHANHLPEGLKIVHNTLNVLQHSPIAATDEHTKMLIRDFVSTVEFEGQVTKAFEKQEWYTKWGKHYIPALLRAHILQVCTNFKDPGLQIYGGPLFKKLQNDIDTVFLKLPPPEPTVKKENYVAPANMGAYYNYGGGCIAGYCKATMADGTIKLIRDIKKGDKVRTSVGSAQVACVLVTKVNKLVEMVELHQGLTITPYHPIRVNGEWKFPNTVATARKQFISEYYNFVLEEGFPSMLVNGEECVGLAHNLTDNDVVSHDYLGTSRVLADLKKMAGWQEGSIEVGEFSRDPVTQRITKLLQATSTQ